MKPGAARIVFAPDSFKGTIGAREAAEAMSRGWKAVRPGDDVACLPMADGGEGTLDAFEASIPGSRRMPVSVPGPMGTRAEASWLLLPSTYDSSPVGVVELANTSGIELLSDKEAMRPLDAGTEGFGRAIVDALAHGVESLILAIGSSASSDGGAGVLRELGLRTLDRSGAPVEPGARGLSAIEQIDLSALRPLPLGGATVLTDVDAPLLGSGGAAAVYAPQKGAHPRQVEQIERALTRWAALLPVDPSVRGAGAAGGTGFGLLAWGAKFTPGAQAVSDLIGLRAAVRSADLVITGEGSFDGQSASGKAPYLVLAEARAAQVQRAVIAGRLGSPLDDCLTVSLTDLAGSASLAMTDPSRWLAAAGQNAARWFDSE